MYQTIAEPIAVAGLYRHGKFVPRKFAWGRRQIQIDQITLTANVTDGGVKKRFYSVTAGADVYRLEFNRDYETWTLAELWVE
jgi:hypothetical protein